MELIEDFERSQRTVPYSIRMAVAAAASKRAEERNTADEAASDEKSEPSTGEGSVAKKRSAANTPPRTPRRQTNTYEKGGRVSSCFDASNLLQCRASSAMKRMSALRSSVANDTVPEDAPINHQTNGDGKSDDSGSSQGVSGGVL